MTAASHVNSRTVTRSVHFYRIRFDPNPTHPARLLQPLLSSVGALPFAESRSPTGGRYWRDASGDELCIWVDDRPNCARFRFAKIRRKALPQIEDSGILAELTLPPSAGFCEASHCVLFGNDIVGVEFNAFAPSATRLPAYLKAVLPHQVVPAAVEILLKGDAAAALTRLQTIRVVDLKIRSSYASAIAQADENLGAAFQAAARIQGAETVSLTLGPIPREHGGLVGIFGAVRRLLDRGDLHQHVLRFHVSGPATTTGRNLEVDLLRDQLVSQEEVVTIGERTRVVESSGAYEAVERAYESLRRDVDAAAAVMAAPTQ